MSGKAIGVLGSQSGEEIVKECGLFPQTLAEKAQAKTRCFFQQSSNQQFETLLNGVELMTTHPLSSRHYCSSACAYTKTSLVIEVSSSMTTQTHDKGKTVTVQLGVQIKGFCCTRKTTVSVKAVFHARRLSSPCLSWWVLVLCAQSHVIICTTLSTQSVKEVLSSLSKSIKRCRDA